MKIYLNNQAIDNANTILPAYIIDDNISLSLKCGDCIVISNQEYKIEKRTVYLKVTNYIINDVDYIIFDVTQLGAPRFVRLGKSPQQLPCCE
jgi:hypothetical protein